MSPYVAMIAWFWSGMFFGYSQAKYTRKKRSAMIIGFVGLLIAIVLTLMVKR